jgi:sec-independent protein translocase protein TatA
MAGLTPAHLLIILFIALIVIGPGKLPEVGAAIGKSVREFKRATGDLQETLTGPLNAQPPAPAQAQAPLPVAYPPQAPYPAAYPPQAPYQPATGVVVPPPAPLGYPAQLGYPAPAGDPAAGPRPALAEYRPATGASVEPPPTPRVG